MQRERKKEIDNILKEKHERYLAAEHEVLSLEEFEERRKERGKRLRKKSRALKVMSEISRYLKSHNIYFEECIQEDIHHITMAFLNCDRCPGGITVR